MRSLPIITFSDMVNLFGAGFATGVVLTVAALVFAAYIQGRTKRNGRR